MAAPCASDPVDGFGQAETIEGLLRGGRDFLEGEVTSHGFALPCDGPSMA
jgi:hypothetical protein